MVCTLLIEISVGEVRAALLEDGEPVEFYMERLTSPSLTGSKFLARVQSISKEMDAAFLDIGETKALLPARRAGSNIKNSKLSTIAPEGCLIIVEIIREPDPRENKLAVAQLIEGPGAKGAPGRIGEIPPPLEAILSIPADQIIVDQPSFTEVRACHKKMRLVSALECASGEQTLFDRYGIHERVGEVLDGKLVLPSGGEIQVLETPAATFFDVDGAGAFKGSEASIAKLKINLEAADRIAAAIRFQNLGGLILIDFVGMSSKKHRDQVLEQLKSQLKRDPFRVECGIFSKFGLVEVRRERRGISLGRRLTSAQKKQLTIESRVLGMLADAERDAHHSPSATIELHLSQDELKWLDAHASLKTLWQQRTGKNLNPKGTK